MSSLALILNLRSPLRIHCALYTHVALLRTLHKLLIIPDSRQQARVLSDVTIQAIDLERGTSG